MGTGVGMEVSGRGGRTVLFGGGNMGIALIKGWAAANLNLSSVSAVDPFPSEELKSLAYVTGVDIRTAPVSEPASSIVIAVKPQTFSALAATIPTETVRGAMVISIMAGVPLVRLREELPEARTAIRAMPNIAIATGAGATAAIAERTMSDNDRALATKLFSGLGVVEWVTDESQMDAVTGLAGSGLAYVFYIVECLTRAGIAAGLSPNMSERLARMTIQGSGALLRSTGQPAEELRAQVTSPQGTTAAGLAVLIRDGRLQQLMTEAVTAATLRSRELSGK